ncbi:MAG: FAD-dependent oxidoreductase [Actinomycetota bacterium]|nr:FAD-dependent oxidoreductase [Actinomycetota bacterium]
MPAATAEFDVLVVGSGPGGSSAAYHLARHGVNVGLVEKAAFPREKVCGDGLTPRAVAALLDMGIDTSAPGFVRVDGLRVYGRRGGLDLPWPVLSAWPGYGLVRTRLDYDELLARRAVEAGATLWERSEAVSPVMDRGWVTGAMVRRLQAPPPAVAKRRKSKTLQKQDAAAATERNGAAAGGGTDRAGADAAAGGAGTRERKQTDAPLTEVRARFVLAADGASSRFGGQVGVRRDPSRPLGIAARRYYRMTRPMIPMLEAWLDLWEGDAIMPGYGWIFPVSDEVVNVGAGLLNTFQGFKDISARRIFDIFIKMLPEDWGLTEENATGPMKSGPLPMGFNRRPLAMPGMLVIGDAGGIVNPFNGEGISYAMETGKLAAELVYESLAKDRPGLAHVYPTLVHRQYGKYYFMGNTFVKLIGNPKIMRFATEHGLHREWLMRFAMRMLANLSDGPRGDVQDKLMYAMERLSPTA